jgi:hypothetical protein
VESAVIGIVALTCGVPRVVATDDVERGQTRVRDVSTLSTSGRADIEMGVTQSALKIGKIRLESTPRDETSAVLRFDMSNAGSHTVTNIVFEISLIEDLSRGRTGVPERVVVGPFTIEARFDLEPADTAEYEALLRNLPPACRCAPRIRVLAVRFFADSGAYPSSVWE